MLTSILCYVSTVRSKHACHLDSGVLSWTCFGRWKVCGGSAHLLIEPCGEQFHHIFFLFLRGFYQQAQTFWLTSYLYHPAIFHCRELHIGRLCFRCWTSMLQHCVCVSLGCSLDAVDSQFADKASCGSYAFIRVLGSIHPHIFLHSA